jgi:hypothetical protein
MLRTPLASLIALVLVSTPASAMDCGAVFDELSKAVSGPVLMSAEKKAAMMRMAISGYDHCMAGDDKRAGDTRQMIMDQIKATLGGK